MKVVLYEVPDRADDEHHVDEGRDQRQQDLKDEDVGERDQTESAFAGENIAMLPDGLKNSERPAEALTHEGIGTGGGLGEGERHVFVFDAVAVAQEGHGEIGVLGDGIDVIAAGLADGGDAPGADGAGNDADGSERVESAAFEVLAGDVFEGLPARPKVDAVADFGVARDRADSGIEEVRHHAGNGVGGNDGVGVDADEELGVADVLESIVQGFGFAAVGLGQG